MKDAVLNFIILIASGMLLLFYDLSLFLRNKKTFSETIWAINRFTLALAFIAGVIAGHLFTVP